MDGANRMYGQMLNKSDRSVDVLPQSFNFFEVRRQRDCKSFVAHRLQRYVFVRRVVVQCGREMTIIHRRLQAAVLSEKSAPQHFTSCRTQRHIHCSEQLQYKVTAVCER